MGMNWNGTLPSNMPELVAEPGAKMFRVPIAMVTEPQAAREVSIAQDDALFLEYAEKGITVLPNVVGVANLKTGKLIPAMPKNSPAREAWKSELNALFDRYGPKGRFWAEHTKYLSLAPEWWEIWNEENYGTQGSTVKEEILPSRYGEVLEAARESIEEGGQIKLLFGGLLSVSHTAKKTTKQESHMKIVPFIKHVGHTADYDGLALHPYAFRGNIVQRSKDSSPRRATRCKKRERNRKKKTASGSRSGSRSLVGR